MLNRAQVFSLGSLINYFKITHLHWLLSHSVGWPLELHVAPWMRAIWPVTLRKGFSRFDRGQWWLLLVILQVTQTSWRLTIFLKRSELAIVFLESLRGLHAHLVHVLERAKVLEVIIFGWGQVIFGSIALATGSYILVVNVVSESWGTSLTRHGSGWDLGILRVHRMLIDLNQPYLVAWLSGAHRVNLCWPERTLTQRWLLGWALMAAFTTTISVCGVFFAARSTIFLMELIQILERK